MGDRGKIKLDPKVRFQNTGFRQQLQSARHYKRTQRKVPEARWESVMDKVGLASWKRRIVAGLVLALAIYAVYVPNVFYIRTIEVTGTADASVQETAERYLRKNPLSAQKNLLLLSEGRLRESLEQNPAIVRVSDIKRKFPNTLLITVEPRIERYLAESNGRYYVVSEDGVAMGEIDARTAASSSATSLKRIVVGDDLEPKTGERPIPERYLSYIQSAEQKLPEAAGLRADKYEIESLKLPEIAIHSAGFKMYLDIQADQGKAYAQLALLLKNLSEQQAGSLHYIDLRYKDKGYLCYKNTPCAQEITAQLQSFTASSTPSSTPESVASSSPINQNQ